MCEDPSAISSLEKVCEDYKRIKQQPPALHRDSSDLSIDQMGTRIPWKWEASLLMGEYLLG